MKSRTKIMGNNHRLPKEYIPFGEIIICGNRFIDGKIPISSERDGKSHEILLIGKGVLPQIWLAVPILPSSQSNYARPKWRYIVERNKTRMKNVEIKSRPNTLILSLGISIILEVNKLTDNIAEVSWLDLRLLGINIYGDKNVLNVGTNQLINNTFEKVHTMLAI